nr:MAG TPA: hypothetical protein [Caudoviricetes sp.]
MSKAVMLSIRPKWCEKIASGEKTIEVRKTKPKLEIPFKCYIYETQGWWERDGIMAFRLGGHVIGEFTCDRIFPINVFDNGSIQNWLFEHMERSCLTYEELADYIGNGKTGHGWRISGLLLYDQPKGLDEFTRLRETKFGSEPVTIKRPPQSWYYVKAMKDG